MRDRFQNRNAVELWDFSEDEKRPDTWANYVLSKYSMTWDYWHSSVARSPNEGGSIAEPPSSSSPRPTLRHYNSLCFHSYINSVSSMESVDFQSHLL